MTTELALAGRGRRLAATAIDLVLVPALAIVLMLVTGVLEHAADWATSAMPILRMVALGLASYLILNFWLLWQRGQTVGKAIMGIAIVSTKTGGQVPLWKLVIRGLFFPTLYLTVWPIAAPLPIIDQLFIFGKSRRCLHDLLCGSSVVRRSQRSSPGAV
ncbi:MAG TPA: RDD family protein [Rhizomicrobium sp.]